MSVSTPRRAAEQGPGDSPIRVTDWRGRCNLAASILNQREPSAKTARMATAALAGADVDALMVMDKVGA